MLHLSQLNEGGIYKLDNKTVRIVSIYREELFEARTIIAVILYSRRIDFGYIRYAVRLSGVTDFEDITLLEKELL